MATRRSTATAAAVLLTTLGCAGAPPQVMAGDDAVGVDTLAWLAGTWVRSEQGRLTEEHWTMPLAGAMFGVNRSIRDEKTVFFEYLRIVEDAGRLSYIAAPRGRNEVAFTLVASGEQAVEFENPGHDFPQRIGYRRDGDSLHATISGIVDGQHRQRSWQWTRR